MFDVIIIGGGPAGLSAGLILGRFRRSVLICDSQKPRNARSTGVHGFLSRDGIHPHELRQIAHEQLEPYTTVQFRTQQVTDIVQQDGRFKVSFGDGTTELAKKILFATGVKDILPPIEGIDALFGKSIFHCPYCHGWEARDKPIAILANAGTAVHYAMLLYTLSSDIVICTNGESEIENQERMRVKVIETPINRISYQDDAFPCIEFADGTSLQREAIFIRPIQEQHSTLPAQLGCKLNEHGYVQVSEHGKTSIEGVYAAGDLTSGMQQVIYAASQGAAAASIINAELAEQAFSAVLI